MTPREMLMIGAAFCVGAIVFVQFFPRFYETENERRCREITETYGTKATRAEIKDCARLMAVGDKLVDGMFPKARASIANQPLHPSVKAGLAKPGGDSARIFAEMCRVLPLDQQQDCMEAQPAR